MVLDFYHLREQPFGVTPDCRHLYASATHREALASLLYGAETRRGFVALIAKPGMGKTTLLYSALLRMQNRARTALLFQTISTPQDFLRALLRDLGVGAATEDLLDLQAQLNEVLVEQSRLGKPVVVIVDEAQNLDGSVLELLRMLSNFETAQTKLLQIVLSGQPQLAEKLASPGLVQLRQRISIVARLEPFSPKETALYIDHKLRTAGYSLDTPLFTTGALSLIAKHSEGIPRNINNLCFNALSLGYALRKTAIDDQTVREVIGDLDLEPLQERKPTAVRTRDAEPQIKSPTLVFAAIQRALLAGWRRKLALGPAILLAVGMMFLIGSRLGSNRGNSSMASVEAATGTPVPASTELPSLRILQNARPMGLSVPGGTSVVQVAPGQNLYKICLASFGRCDGHLLHAIQKLNPKLRSLNHLEPGWTIRIPVSSQTAGAITDSSTLMEGNTQ